MRIRYALAVGVVLVVTGAGVADAAPGDTSTTFSVTAGALSIAVPASAALGSVLPGNTVTAQLGAVTVTDARALLTAAWTASVVSTSFQTGGGTAPETIATSAVSYWSGAATATAGTATFTPGQATAGAAQTLASSRTAFTATAGVGNNTAAWNPTLVVAVPAGAVGGTYTGTVTHSVA
ncbi:hypothetical protein [Kitasatospora sp. MAP5-34]|uniref:hypothetical protein n=1 Tax=Kitasatospora sp. MAP5-34 TaxID=3035102 RepID=UPI0024765BBE|nr:hypothetical protein [Kitasatospora sp. MAP5-34]MDH6580461.1 hypothetical protein [Kitasatospora sp. MAP5-34]